YDYRDLVVFNDTELIMAGANNASHGVVYKSTASGASPTMLNFDTPTGVTNLGIAHLLTVPGDSAKSKIWALTVPSTYASLFISYIGDQAGAWRDIGPVDIIAPSGAQPLPVAGQLWMDGSTLKVYDGSAWRSVNVT
ncbi:MAG: hypothetical protein ACPL7K_02825, partial [Armatimonadota bacterium]